MRRQPPNLRAAGQLLGSGSIWIALAFVLLMALFFSSFRIGTVSGEEVGILLHRLTGKLTVINQSGVKIYSSVLNDFFTLDKTIQNLDMTGKLGEGDRPERDDLKIKTVDGSDVNVDLRVQYRIDPTMAAEVVQSSGPGDSFKTKWARDYVRSICRNYLGELTTEEFYDPAKRDSRVIAAKTEINRRLKKFGVIIDHITIPQRPRFYEEYEQKIKEKKEADQTVQAEQSKALAAQQKQAMLIVVETNAMNVAVKEFEGKMRQLVIAAEAEANKATKEADAYYEQKTIAAGAKLYELTQQADGIKAQKRAEADGVMAMRKALEGVGGPNLVKLEYARRLADVTITGKPYTVDSNVERFEHLRGAESVGGK